jgi:hypothetical protein
MYTYRATAIGGKTSRVPVDNTTKFTALRLLPLMWKLILAFFKCGNCEIHYHLCGAHAEDSWDCPMEAENIEIRHALTGNKLTIW